jgi:RHS repeat-associated protein
MYDEAGHILGEYTATGALIQETIWMGDTPIATLQPNGSSVAIYDVHTDHLGTPRKITRPSDNGLMWRWDPDTFGTAAPSPTGLGTFNYNLRFSGQYSLIESGLYYNYFRTYDPRMGRYLESDPIGLRGGSNTYAYTLGNPISNKDPTGLLGGPDLPPIVDFYLYHWFRNGNNVVPPTYDAATNTPGWHQIPDAMAAYHQYGFEGKYNTKWLDKSGHCEAVYDKRGNLVTDPLNGGTYNFVSPEPWWNPDNLFGHYFFDMLPYFVWGNGPIIVTH